MLDRFQASICVVWICLSLTACYGPVTLSDSHEVKSIVFPDIDKITTAKVGDVLVVSASKTISPALRISALTTFGKAEGETSVFYCGLTFEPGLVPQRGSIESMGRSGICYGPYRGSATAWDGTTSSMGCNGYTAQMDICQDIIDGTYFVYYPNYNKSPVIPLEQDFDNISKTEMVVSNDSNFLMEIVYLGRIENRLKFLFRKSRGDLSEPSYEKEWNVSLGEELTLVESEGARLQIISANDNEVTYRVESNFQ